MHVFDTLYNFEQHSQDWSRRIEKLDSGRWQIVFDEMRLDVMPTREAARIRIREYKREPALAVCTYVHGS